MQAIHLDISNIGIIPEIQAKQTDVGRKILVTVTDGGLPYHIADSTQISVWFEGDSGTGNYSDIGNEQAVIVSKNTITVTLIEQMLKNPGKGRLCLLLNGESGEQLGLWNIPYAVQHIPGFSSKPAEEYFTAFSESAAALAKATLEIYAKQDRIDSLINVKNKSAAGLIYPLATENVPKGFLLCDGAEYSRTEYAELFDAIGTVYGEGDGSTTFNVPNLSTRVPVGAGGDYNLGDTGGEESVRLTVAQMPSHNHSHTVAQDKTGSITLSEDALLYKAKGNTTLYEGKLDSESVGGDQPHNNMQPYTVVNYIISTGKEVEFIIGGTGSSGGIVESAVLYTEQTLTPEQQAQARANIGSAEKAVLTDVLDALPDEMRELTPTSVQFDTVLTQGGIDYNNGSEIVQPGRVRTDCLPVGIGIVGTVPEGSTQQFAIRVYNSQKEYLGYATYTEESGFKKGTSWGAGSHIAVDDIISIYPSASYIRMIFNASNLDAVLMEFVYPSSTLGGLNGITLDEVYGRTKKQPYSENDIAFEYFIDETRYTRGFLKLPANYVPFGKPVPLIVFVHGSGSFGSLHASSMGGQNDAYYNFLRDCGYAIFDCFGWGNTVTGIAQSTFGTPTNNQFYISGIKYVCEHYNIDEGNVFVTCKSLGGIQALALCYQNAVKINACGMLAPALDLLCFPANGNQTTRVAIANDLGFTGDWDALLNVPSESLDTDAIREYLQTQTDKFAGINPFWKSVLLPIDDKMSISFGSATSYNNDAYRLGSVPIKVWIAPDDAAVRYNESLYLVSTLQNAGCTAELRTMPSGTGGHYSVDRDPNAPQTTDVTTRLGIHYDTVPTAYYELEKYFSSFLFSPKSV